VQQVELDPIRHPPELVAFFEHHRQRWLAGEIRLKNYLTHYYQVGNETRPLWYAPPLGYKVIPDKAEIFDLLGYRPSHPACLAHANLAQMRVFSGGARAGKSLWAAHEMIPPLLSPNVRMWLVGPEYEQCLKEFEYILEAVETDEIRRDWAPMLQAGRIRNSPKSGDMEIVLKWQGAGDSFVKVKSVEREARGALLSEELDLVTVVEASVVKERIWSRFLQMRLTTRNGVALFPSTPDGTNWFNELYLRGLSGKSGVYSINADSRMNPTMSLENLATWTHPDSMSDEDFEEQVRGRPTPPHGRVYKDFSRDLHVDTWRGDWPKESWRRARSFDFGYKDPYVVLWASFDGDTFYVYREFYRSLHLTSQVVKHIADVEGWEHRLDEVGDVTLEGEAGRLEAIELGSVADHDASQRAELRRAGISTRRARKEVDAGIRTLSDFLRLQGNGCPRIYIHPRCANLIRELESYQWGKDGKPKRHQDDHAVDALRYLVHTLGPRNRDMRIQRCV
jgi:hypothetical protein